MADEEFPRARVRTTDDRCTVVTTLAAGVYRSVVFTDKETEALIEAIQHSRLSPLTTFAVDWDEKGRAE